MQDKKEVVKPKDQEIEMQDLSKKEVLAKRIDLVPSKTHEE